MRASVRGRTPGTIDRTSPTETDPMTVALGIAFCFAPAVALIATTALLGWIAVRVSPQKA